MNGSFVFGALAMLALVTFAPPAVAAWPSEKLRQFVSWLWSKINPNTAG